MGEGYGVMGLWDYGDMGQDDGGGLWGSQMPWLAPPPAFRFGIECVGLSIRASV